MKKNIILVLLTILIGACGQKAQEETKKVINDNVTEALQGQFLYNHDIVILDKEEQAPFQEQIDNDIKKSEPEVKNNKDDALLNDSVDESKELEDEMFNALTK